MYQVILINDEVRNHNYYYSYVESDNTSLGNVSCNELPAYADSKKARSCYWDGESWVFDSDKYDSIVAQAESDRISALTTLSVSEKLSVFADLINVEEAPSENGEILPKKLGYKWVNVCSINNGVPSIGWKLIVDPDYVPVNDGSDYLKAINWNDGDTVTQGLWYNVGNDLIWQAIKSGTPASGEDKEYFDIP